MDRLFKKVFGICMLLTGIMSATFLHAQQEVVIRSVDEQSFTGFIYKISADTIFMETASGDTLEFSRSGIAAITLPRRSPFLRRAGAGFGGGFLTGEFFGLVQPVGTEHDFTRSERVTAFGLGTAGIAALITGTISGLRSVDLDVPWWRLDDNQQRRVLSELMRGNYGYGVRLRLAPWLGDISVAETGSEEKERSRLAGARLRLAFTPRSGLEFTVARSGWYNISHSLRSGDQVTARGRADYLGFNVFYAYTANRRFNPFSSFGVMLIREKQREAADRVPGGDEEILNASMTNSYLPLNLYAGAEILLLDWISLDLRGGAVAYPWQGHAHLSYQAAINFGSPF